MKIWQWCWLHNGTGYTSSGNSGRINKKNSMTWAIPPEWMPVRTELGSTYWKWDEGLKVYTCPHFKKLDKIKGLYLVMFLGVGFHLLLSILNWVFSQDCLKQHGEGCWQSTGKHRTVISVHHNALTMWLSFLGWTMKTEMLHSFAHWKNKYLTLHSWM